MILQETQWEEVFKTLIPVISSIIIAVGGLIVAFLQRQKRKLEEINHKKERHNHNMTKIEFKKEKEQFRSKVLIELKEMNRKLDKVLIKNKSN